MTFEEEQSNALSPGLITNTTTTQTENLGQQARLESSKCFETSYAKLLPKIQKHIAVASAKGLWRVRVELPRSPWMVDKENQRRVVQKLKDNDLSAHFKLHPNKVLLVIFWSEFDMKRTSLELLEAIEEIESSQLPKQTKQKMIGFEQQQQPTTPKTLLIEPTKEAQVEQSYSIVNTPATEVVIHNELGDSSEEEQENALVPLTKEVRVSQKLALKEARLAEKEQRKAAKMQQVQEMKRARLEEKIRQKQLMKNKERLEEREKKKEEKLKRKAIKEQRKLNREKKEKNDEKKKKSKIEKKKKERKETSSSEDRTWSESDLSSSRSDSESD